MLLRKIAAVLGAEASPFHDNSVRVFADDMAVTVEDVDSALPKLHTVFYSFALMSDMKLNHAKTVMIPLWGTDVVAIKEAQDILIRVCPARAAFVVAGAGKYLGFWIGPDRGIHSWIGPQKKFRDRVTQLSQQNTRIALQRPCVQSALPSCSEFYLAIGPSS